MMLDEITLTQNMLQKMSNNCVCKLFRILWSTFWLSTNNASRNCVYSATVLKFLWALYHNNVITYPSRS